MKSLTVTITLTEQEVEAFEAFCNWLEQHRGEGVEYQKGVEVALSHFLSQWQHQIYYVYSAVEREEF
jgi:hypothetical protein